jgi:hypothetical protein
MQLQSQPEASSGEVRASSDSRGLGGFDEGEEDGDEILIEVTNYRTEQVEL